MRKIPTLFKRDENDLKHVTSEVNTKCQWVIDGEGVPTRKFDGTSCLVDGGRFFKRYEVKKGKTPPPDFVPADEVDAETGKHPGWVGIHPTDPSDKFHREAWRSWELTEGAPPPDGTYELVGPKVQGNSEGYSAHVLINHATETAFDDATPEPPRNHDGLRDWMLTVAADNNYEGIVWHHPDGRMAKLKRRDFS
jgi:Family of unknown function (DUF5565)